MKRLARLFLSVIALAALLCAALPADIAMAAAKITYQSGKSISGTVYAGKKYDLRVQGYLCVFSSSDKSVASIGKTSGVMTCKNPGTVKITAKNKKTGKTIVTKTFTVLLRSESIAINEESDVLYMSVGETNALTAALTPADSTDIVNYKSSDNAVASVTSLSGKITARKQGVAEITVYARATKSSKLTASTTKTDTIRVYVGNALKSASRLSGDALVLNFAQDCESENLEISDFTVTMGDGGERLEISAMNISGHNVLLTLENPPEASAKLRVTHNGVTVSAEDEVVKAMRITPLSLNGEPLRAELLGGDGKRIASYTYGANLPGELAFTLEGTFYSEDGGVLSFSQPTGSAIARAAWTPAAGGESIACEHTYTPTNQRTYHFAVAREDAAPDWDAMPEAICLNETDFVVRTRIDNGTDQAEADEAYDSITYRSSDESILRVQGEGRIARITPVAAGAANVLVLENGTAYKTLPIDVRAARRAATLSLKATSARADIDALPASVRLGLTLKDQYGDAMALNPEMMRITPIYPAGQSAQPFSLALDGNGEIVLRAAQGLNTGIYRIKLSCADGYGEAVPYVIYALEIAQNERPAAIHTVRYVNDKGEELLPAARYFDNTTFVLPNVPAKEGHYFNGWNITTASGQSLGLLKDTALTLTESVKCVAEYGVHYYPVYYYMGTGSAAGDSVVKRYVPFGDHIILPADPQLAGMIFMGYQWSTASGKKPATMPAYPLKAYAQWAGVSPAPSSATTTIPVPSTTWTPAPTTSTTWTPAPSETTPVY